MCSGNERFRNETQRLRQWQEYFWSDRGGESPAPGEGEEGSGGERVDDGVGHVQDVRQDEVAGGGEHGGEEYDERDGETD